MLLDNLTEGNDYFGVRETYGIQLFVNDSKQMVVIMGMDFNEEIKGFVGTMAFYHFGYLIQSLYSFIKRNIFFNIRKSSILV